MGKYLKFILLFLFTVFIFWFFGRSLDWAEVSRSLRKTNAVYLTAAIMVVCFGYFLRSLRWRTLLKPITETSLKEVFATTTIGFAAVSLIGRAGEVVRPMWLSMRDARVRPAAAFVTLFLERICDLAALIFFFAVNLLWITPPPGRENDFAYVRFVGILLLAGVVCGIFALWLFQMFSSPFTAWLENQKLLKNKLGNIFLSLCKQLAAALKIFRSGREFLAVVGWTIAVWLSIALPTQFVISAFGLPLDFSDALFVMGWAIIGSIVPTPGGAAGAFHAATAGGLIFLGIDREQAAAASIVMHLVYFAPALFFGIYYFLRGDISITRLRSLVYYRTVTENDSQITIHKTT